MEAGEWLLKRGDFRARWNPNASHGHIHQSRSPYAIDAVLRIVHSLILARQGGFLVHAASAIRDGKAFLFSGVSGAGKTTISRLAPPDAKLLTDEISYVRREGNRYLACGTPFAGELARVGENQSRPYQPHCFCLRKACRTRIEPVGAYRSRTTTAEEHFVFRAMILSWWNLFFSRRASLLVWFPSAA